MSRFKLDSKIDKTHPIISASLSSQPNLAGWYKEPVSISYSCSDNLSGIITCPEAKSVATDGIDKLIIAEVSDKASNLSDDVQRINLDQTPPVLRLVSHKPHELFNTIRPNLTFLMTDNMSLKKESFSITITGTTLNCDVQGGIVRCELDADLADGELTLHASVSDTADNITDFSFVTALDLDADLVANHLDECAETPKAESVNEDGCGFSQLDSDLDGVVNGLDRCLNTLPGVTVEVDGCDETQRDTDLDGVFDVDDLFPKDPEEYSDLDRDGVGDNSDADMDGDGFSNTDEITAGSLIDSATSVPELKFLNSHISKKFLVSEGQTTKISWETQGALSVYLKSNHEGIIAQELDVVGSIILTPALTTFYTLVAMGPSGEISFNENVEMQLPEPAPLWPEPISLTVGDAVEQVGTSLSLSKAGEAYVGSYDTNYYKISASGQRLWTLKDVGVVISQAVFLNADQGEQNNLIIAADTSETINKNSAGMLYKIEADKKIEWSYPTESAVFASVTVSEEKNEVYAISNKGVLHVVNSETGGAIWQLEIAENERFTAKPTLVPEKDLLIINAKSGKIYAVSTVNKGVLWVRDLK